MPAEASSAVVGEWKKQYTVVRLSEHPHLITKADVQTQKGSKLAPVNSRVKGNSNKSQTKNRSTDQIRSKASSRDREGQRRDALKRHGGSKFRSHTSQTIPNSHCTGIIVPPCFKGSSEKARRNSLVTHHALLVYRHFTQELPVLQSLLFQGASFSFDVVGPLHTETDPAAQYLQLPPVWCSPCTLVANRDSVRCRGPTGGAAVHTIRQTFV